MNLPNTRRKKMSIKSNNPETLVLHAGPRSDGVTGAGAMPIIQTTSYQFRSTAPLNTNSDLLTARPGNVTS